MFQSRNGNLWVVTLDGNARRLQSDPSTFTWEVDSAELFNEEFGPFTIILPQETP